MADETNILDQLISRVPDESLRSHLAREVDLLRGSRHFGLVFDRHLPESVRLLDYPIRKGVRVALRDESSMETWTVVGFADQDRKVAVLSGDGGERPVDDLAVVREFGEPVYPGLRSVDRIPNGPEDSPWHVVINGENYHALQTLRSTHREKIDLIYIDPPYNTGNDGWIYNDRYVDQADRAKSSKWLSFLERRLLIARDLLKPSGVICISIGTQEVHRLMCLCEQLFRSRSVQCITVQTSGGKPSNGLDYMHEYLIAITPETFEPCATTFTGGVARSPWERMTLTTFTPVTRPNQAYPIFVDIETGALRGVGKSLGQLISSGEYTGDKADFVFETDETPEGCMAVWPITSQGKECVWRLIPESLLADWEAGLIRITPEKLQGKPSFRIQYIAGGNQKKYQQGVLVPSGQVEGVPTLIFGAGTTAGTSVPTIWREAGHRTNRGNKALSDILGEARFPYPKPLDLLTDILLGFGQGNPDAVILDFFAGSGTTAEAVMRLNAEDGGSRQSIIVTNNELSATEAKKLRKAGLHPGDAEWESKGIFEYVCRPRISTVLTGKRPDGSEYSDGLPANVEMFDLVYLDPSAVRRGIEFPKLAPLFWLQGGARGERIEGDPGEGWALTATYGVLFDIDTLVAFADAVTAAATAGEPPGVLFIVSDSLAEYQQAVERLPVGIDTVQLYEDYLLNYTVNFSGGVR
ncbi:site-specific DNA-methyltransferase [Mycobacteroides abscessus]|uniref:site-specific DNA-methyltransferase n=1 Tax=Mycobacteroides abscessus TaxID=36809 RepID=UPI000C2636A2|nr:site-specific DNA-methyltransferase [Mycobacteroides abscessus]RIS67511.1 site-specific DNA-methyltransferase [Mycobacteroides abscessus]